MRQSVRSRGSVLLLAPLAVISLCGLAFTGGFQLRARQGPNVAVAARVTPLGSQVLLEEIDEAEETGGLVLSEGSKKKTRLRLGRIEALGSGQADKREPKLLEALQVGDTVLWEDFSNRKLEEDPDSKLFLVPIRSVKAKVNSK
mmetsp:Transcript_40622/g.75604  ORF Transcript_40622/g.75604 Transcript_40622/m.75604 type:complete len:144 (-) Transcript_40622:65-496(-)